MSEVTKASIEAAIKTYIEPSLGRDLIGAACVKGIEIEGGNVKVGVLLGFPAKGVVEVIAAALRERIAAVPGVASAEVAVTWKVVAHSVQKSLKPIFRIP